MARFPGAIWKPITASKGRQKLTVHNRMNLHVAVSEGSSLHNYFNKSGIPDSHFYVRRDGTVEQYVDTSMRAFADLEGNDATISVETQGMGGGGWDVKQRESLAKLYAWAVETHGLEVKLATDSKPGKSSQGLSWHRLGCDGNFPALPSILAGRGQRGGGMHYSTSLGKVCPGDGRIVQIPGIFARAKEILNPTSTPAPTTPAPISEDDELNATQATQLSNINAAIPELLALYSGAAPGVQPSNDADEISFKTAMKWLLVRTQIIEATVTAQSAALTAVAESQGLDPAVIQATVKSSVDAALANVSLTLSSEA